MGTLVRRDARRARSQPHEIPAAFPLAEAKLAAPQLRRQMIDRPRIAEALDAGEAAAVLTLVAAPLGYGKTTAVRSWCAARTAQPAWVTLDAGDNDPSRLWTYVATAVDRVREGLGRAALQRLRAGRAPVDVCVDELMNGIAAFGDELTLVLDDLHTVTDTECLASIDRAIEHLPANAHMVALTRTDPALRLPHRRARGDLADLRASELAFTPAETRELIVDRARIHLDAAEIELLCERTEGWPAALFLAALWLRSLDDPHVAVREFGGDHRFVADFLSNEVIDSLDDDARSFVLRACVLGRFTAELCDAVLDRTDSAMVLADLARSNLFVARLARGGWYRVHSLFAEFGGFQLESREPGAETEIHRRAAGWLRSRGLPVEAAQHASAAGDHEVVADLLLDHHLAMIRNGGERTLLDWVQTLPDGQLVAHPELAVGAATAALTVGRAAPERRRFLQLAEQSREVHPELFSSYAQAVHGMVGASAVDGDVDRAVRDGRDAVDVARAEAPAVLVPALGGYARALFFAGDLDEAWQAALQAADHPEARRAPGHAFARSTLALVAAERAWLSAARKHAETAKSLVGGIGSGRSWLAANASVALGCVLAEEGSLVEAERELAYAENFFADEVATVHHAWLLVLVARVRCRRGRLDEAATALRSALEEIGELGDSGRLPLLAAGVTRELEGARARAARGEVLAPPSEAELAVLRLLSSDLSIREIGGALYLSPNTVRSHTRAIYRKLGVNSRAQAVARAEVLGLLARADSPM